MGRPPKDPSQRVNRNKPATAEVELPAEGRSEPAPKLPTKRPAWLKQTRGWWEAIWRSPMATQWQDADIPSLVRLARLIDTVNRTDGRKSWMGSQQSNLLSEIRQLEDRYGLSPAARQRLRWKVAQPEEPEQSKAGNVRRLHAVDASAVAR